MMKLRNFKPKKQRKILKDIANYLAETAQSASDDIVDTVIDTIQDGFLDVLNEEDFFGTEGWEHMLGLDDE